VLREGKKSVSRVQEKKALGRSLQRKQFKEDLEGGLKAAQLR